MNWFAKYLPCICCTHRKKNIKYNLPVTYYCNCNKTIYTDTKSIKCIKCFDKNLNYQTYGYVIL